MKKKVYLFNSAVIVLITVFFTWFLSNDIFLGDDISEILNLTPDTAKYNINGFFTGFITKIFCINLPLIFHIHPHQFSMTAGAFLRAVNIALLCGIVSCFLFAGREKKSYFGLGVLFSAYYFCYASSNLNVAFKNLLNIPRFESEGSFFLITEYSHHFGQILSLILGLAFIYLIVTCFINENFTDKKYIVPCCILGFLSASSSMYVSVIVGTFCALTGLYYLILIFFVNRNSVKDFLNSDKKVFFPILFFCLGIIIFAFYPGYSSHIQTDFSFLNSLKIVVKGLLSTVPLEIASILILSTALYFMALYKTTCIKRTIYSGFGILAGILIYLFMLSAEGKNLTISLADSFVLIRITLLSVIFLILGVCIRELETEPKVRKILLSGFIIIYGLFSLVQLPFVFTTMSIWRAINQENKTVLYCVEKMYRFYSLSGKTAVLPDDSLLRIMKINCFLNDKSVTDETVKPQTLFKYTDFTTGYYTTFYKNPQIVAYQFIPTDIAIRIFHAMGGEITKEEFEKPNFQKLYDDNFVLNKKG